LRAIRAQNRYPLLLIARMRDPRHYPDRPFLAVSAVIVRDGEFLAVRRARPPMQGLFTLPGGGVEAGESLAEAVRREVQEETGLTIEPVTLAGYREVIARDERGRVERHFVILAFAARWVAGEPRLNDEVAEARWMRPAALRDLATTEGLAEIVAAASNGLNRGLSPREMAA
jgi:8-oxo-dGTP diphosphatase